MISWCVRLAATAHAWFVNSLAKLVAKLVMEREELQAGFLSRPLVFLSTEIKIQSSLREDSKNDLRRWLYRLSLPKVLLVDNCSYFTEVKPAPKLVYYIF